MRVPSWLSRALRFRNAGALTAPSPDRFLTVPWLREAGVPITADTAVQVSAVYGCCRLIVDSLAAAPVRVYEIESEGRRQVLYDDQTAYLLNWGADITRAPDAPSAQAIEEALFWSALLYGNGYAEIQRDNAGKVFALWPIEPDRVTPRREGSAYWYEIALPQGGTAELAARDCFHLRGPSRHGWVGGSTVFDAAKAIGIGQAAQVFASAYFSRGTIIGAVLTSDKIVTKEQADKAKEQFQKDHGGPYAAHGLAVLGQGLKLETINHNAQESQLVESRRFQVQEIARFFGVPTTLLADNEAWTNISELYLGFYRNALLPWVERFDGEATRKLFPQRQPWREVQHDLTRLTLGSFKDLVSGLKEAVNNGLKTRNEARAILGDNSIGPDGDVLMAQTTVVTLKDVLAGKTFGTPDSQQGSQSPIEAEPSRQPGETLDEEMPDEAIRQKKQNGARAVARAAVALDRYSRKMKMPELSEHERNRLNSWVVKECLEAVPLTDRGEKEIRITKAMESVLQGEPPHLAAERMHR